MRPSFVLGAASALFANQTTLSFVLLRLVVIVLAARIAGGCAGRPAIER